MQPLGRIDQRGGVDGGGHQAAVRGYRAYNSVHFVPYLSFPAAMTTLWQSAPGGSRLISRNICILPKPDSLSQASTCSMGYANSEMGLHTSPDTYMSLTHSIRTDDETFFRFLNQCPASSTAGYAQAWKKILERREKAHCAYADAAPYSDFTVWRALCRTIPEGSHLEIANSAAIRYSQLFDLPCGVSVGCNRGTSGIDGSSSTAVGAAVALAPRVVTLVSGDLSFLYDSNALWNESLPANLRLIVLNNGGGGIFRILNGARNSSFGGRYLQASHGITLDSLARMYSLEYRRAENKAELLRALSDFWAPCDRARLLEIDTRGCENDAVLRGYFARLHDRE